MKQFTLGQYTLDDFADYLNGAENPYFDGVEGNELLIQGTHHLTKTINLHFPVVITGDDAYITGDNQYTFAFAITASNTTIQNITFTGFKYGVDVDAMGNCVENIHIKGLKMTDALSVTDVGSSVSGSVLRNIFIEDCTAVVAFEQWETEDYAEFALSFNVCCARHKGGEKIENCLIENVHINRCRKEGQSRAGITVMSAMPVGTNYTLQNLAYSNLVMRGIYITDNYIDLCWDSALNVTGAFINTGAVLIEDVVITGNDVHYGIGGIGITGASPHFGESGGSVIRNIVINENNLVREIEDIGETTRGICVCTSRGDYYPGLTSRDCLTENIEIAHNKIDGGGIGLYAVYEFLDGKAQHINNVLRNANVHDNKIMRTEVAFYFETVEADGRLYDWYFGFPRHDKKWGDKIEDHSVITAILTDNRMENITCVDNTIEGYRFKVVAAGAYAWGHCLCENNKVSKDIVFERNHFGVGGNHLHVADFIGFDYARDGGGNEVSTAFKV